MNQRDRDAVDSGGAARRTEYHGFAARDAVLINCVHRTAHGEATSSSERQGSPDGRLGCDLLKIRLQPDDSRSDCASVSGAAAVPRDRKRNGSGNRVVINDGIARSVKDSMEAADCNRAAISGDAIRGQALHGKPA